MSRIKGCFRHLFHLFSISINQTRWPVACVHVQIPALRVFGMLIGKWGVGSCPSAERVVIVTFPEVIKAGLSVSLLAGEFVVIGIIVEELKFPTPRIKVFIFLDDPRRVRNYRGGLQMVGEVV